MNTAFRNIGFFLLATSAYASAPDAPIGSDVSDAVVKVAVLPTYPARAMKRGTDGDITVAFTISKYGRAIDPEVVSESAPGVFDDTVLDALNYWAFEPARPLYCGTVEQRATQAFRFRHQDERPVQILPTVIEGQATLPRPHRKVDSVAALRIEGAANRSVSQVVKPTGLVPVRRVEPAYPDKALSRRREGMVALSFLIEKDGSVSEVEVVDAERASLFKAAAMRAMRQWRFEPYLRDGVPAERTGCHEFVFHVDEYLRKQKNQKNREENVLTFGKPD